MSRSLSTRGGRALAVAALVPLLALAAACGDDDDSSSSGSGSGGNNGGSGGSQSADDFCNDFESLNERMSDIDDPSGDQLQEALDQLQDIDPPAELQDEWDALAESLESLDFNDPTNADPQAAQQFSDAIDSIGTYVDENCDVQE
jgi:hypothetical protein